MGILMRMKSLICNEAQTHLMFHFVSFQPMNIGINCHMLLRCLIIPSQEGYCSILGHTFVNSLASVAWRELVRYRQRLWNALYVLWEYSISNLWWPEKSSDNKDGIKLYWAAFTHMISIVVDAIIAFVLYGRWAECRKYWFWSFEYPFSLKFSMPRLSSWSQILYIKLINKCLQIRFCFSCVFALNIIRKLVLVVFKENTKIKRKWFKI